MSNAASGGLYQQEIEIKIFCRNEKAYKFVAATKILINQKNMNKAELIAKVADDAGITKTQANAALDSFVEAVTKTLKGGGKVSVST